MRVRTVVFRFIALGGLLGLVNAWDWMPIRVLLRDVIGWSVRVSGYNPISFVHEGSPALSVEGKVHYYTVECTYLDLLMVVLPFVWVFTENIRMNILRVGIAALVILGWNLVRCWAAVYLDVRGVNRFYAHDLPVYSSWSIAVVGAVLAAIRRDFAGGIYERVSVKGVARRIGWNSADTHFN